ncbi:MAG: carboxymuconolactone decarboxylase family protein [Bacteroidota bacterium]
MSNVADFHAFREKMNARILASDSKIFKRIYNLDSRTYEAGALDAKTKELLGLSASLVLRCDDCVRYHLDAAVAAGASEAELIEVFEVGLVVGGTIVIPHLRRAFAFLDELAQKNTQENE